MAVALPRHFEFFFFKDKTLFYNWETMTDEEIGGGSQAQLYYDELEQCSKVCMAVLFQGIMKED
jgi:hypothetical protein